MTLDQYIAQAQFAGAIIAVLFSLYFLGYQFAKRKRDIKHS